MSKPRETSRESMGARHSMRTFLLLDRGLWGRLRLFAMDFVFIGYLSGKLALFFADDEDWTWGRAHDALCRAAEAEMFQTRITMRSDYD